MQDNKAISREDFERMFFSSERWEEFAQRLVKIAYAKLNVDDAQNAPAVILHTSLRLTDDSKGTIEPEIIHFHFLLEKSEFDHKANDDENGTGSEPDFL